MSVSFCGSSVPYRRFRHLLVCTGSRVSASCKRPNTCRHTTRCAETEIPDSFYRARKPVVRSSDSVQREAAGTCEFRANAAAIAAAIRQGSRDPTRLEALQHNTHTQTHARTHARTSVSTRRHTSQKEFNTRVEQEQSKLDMISVMIPWNMLVSGGTVSSTCGGGGGACDCKQTMQACAREKTDCSKRRAGAWAHAVCKRERDTKSSVVATRDTLLVRGRRRALDLGAGGRWTAVSSACFPTASSALHTAHISTQYTHTH
jgi:hypothetical protein